MDDAFAACSLLVLARRDQELRATWVRGRAMIRDAVAAALRDSGRTTGVDDTAASLLGVASHLRESVLLGELSADAARRRLSRALRHSTEAPPQVSTSGRGT